MKIINIHHAKQVALSALAMTSCGFVLWLSQVNGQADANQPAVQTNTQANAVAQTTTSTNAQQPVATSTDTQQVTTTSANAATQTEVNQNDHGNYANMDSQKINDQGQLVASGWHATNESAGKNYHYIIAYDQTNNREIARQNITGTNAIVNRPDVQAAHNVTGAVNSGFKVTFDLSKVIANTGTVQLISRYSSDPAGNSNNVDYWFAPITINRNNYGSLDSASVVDGQLHLAGWHASNQASGRAYHYVIVIDRTTGQEVARVKATDGIARPDVARIYSDVDGAGRSGFIANIDLNKLNFNHQLQVLSRYTSDPSGNSNYLDYWFTPITTGNFENRASFDSINWSNKNNVTVAGWHADDVSQFENNHFLILYDNTANRQVAVTEATSQNRADVAKAFPAINTAGRSGFTGSFALTGTQLVGGHSYSIVSRYSTSNQGNGGNGYYTDFWSTPMVLNHHAACVDSLKMLNNGVQISGWMASDYSSSYPYAYAIVLNNNREVARQALTLGTRADVAKAYPSIYNSEQSGFNQLIPLDPAAITGTLQVILRFSNDRAGNGSFDDQRSNTYASNQGYFDQATFDGTTVHVSGWHASNQSATHKYHWLIAVDQNGHELGRWQVTNANVARPDLGQAVGYILNSDHSGFSVTFTATDNMQHKVIRLIDRLTDDPAGNGNAIDVYSNGVSINSGSQTTGLKTLYYDAMGNVVGVFNNAEVICQNPELPTGCEMTAVTMMLRYAGVNINKFQVAAETPRSSNGNYGFVGDPYSPSGWWVFPTGIAPVVQRHLGTSQVMTGSSLQAIKDKLNIGHLVVVWMANMNGFVNHAITLTGYNGNGFYYNNPWTGQKEAMSYSEFYSHWNADAQRALSY